MRAYACILSKSVIQRHIISGIDVHFRDFVLPACCGAGLMKDI